MRSTTLALAAAARAPAGAARARGVAAAAGLAAGAGGGVLGRPRGTCTSTGSRRSSSWRPRARTRRSRSTRRRTRARCRGSTRRCMSRAARARSSVREAALARRWCVSVWPTPALAQDAGMSVADFAAFVSRALFLDRDDPAAAWRELSASQARLVERLAAASELRIEGEGTDLVVGVAGRVVDQLGWAAEHALRRGVHRAVVRVGRRPLRRPVVAAGRAGLGRLAWSSATASSSRRAPTRATRCCRRCSPPTTAPAGSARSASARTPASTERSGLTLLDEKIGGTVHLALGRSYPETGGTNESAIHWDLICRPDRLTADGEPIAPLEGGEFQSVSTFRRYATESRHGPENRGARGRPARRRRAMATAAARPRRAARSIVASRPEGSTAFTAGCSPWATRRSRPRAAGWRRSWRWAATRC